MCFFFFQAEDGIRDGRVTGVQTCALPISRVEALLLGDDRVRFSFTNVEPGTYAVIAEQKGFDTGTSIVTLSATEGATVDLARSEERRVGKECRSGRQQ